MYLIFLGILTIGVAIYLIVRYEKAQKVAAKPQPNYNEIIMQKMGEDFQALGWDVWDPSVHRANGQLDRIRRAATDKRLTVIEYDGDFGTATIKGAEGNTYTVSGERCTCPDFRTRGLPCKHMYLLAMALSEEENDQ